MDFKADTEQKITALVEQRKPIYRLNRTDDVVTKIDDINAELRRSRKCLWLCKGVEENSERVRNNIKRMENMDRARKDVEKRQNFIKHFPDISR